MPSAFLPPAALSFSSRPHCSRLTSSKSPMPTAKISVGHVSTNVAASLHALALQTLKTSPTFSIAISGGSLPRLLAAGLPPSLSLENWTVFLADERKVPLDHADSNYRAVLEQMPSLNLIPINPDLKIEDCASDYQRKLVDALGENPVFDAVLLGLGPDGHTCSLFPEHPLLQESNLLVAPISDSPKPPPERVTLTYPVLNAAKVAMFVCTGAGKAPVVKDILENPDSSFPGALVKSGVVEWYLDEAAAGEISKAAV